MATIKIQSRTTTLRLRPTIPTLKLKVSAGVKGDKGDLGTAASIAVGDVTTLNPGEDATVVNSGTSSAAILDFGIPEGEQGVQGIQGIQGEQGIQGPPGADGAGAVDSVNGQTGVVVLDPDDLDDTSTTNKFASAARVASLIHAATGKTTPVDADEFGGIDSAASNVLKKFTWANIKATLQAYFDTLYLAAGIARRELLTADRTYYVRTDGSDSNTGLVNSSGGAFLTLQKAINTVAALDISIYNVTISVGAGTYTAGVTVNGPWVGTGTVSLVGDTTTPSNVIISTTGSNCVLALQGGKLTIGGFKFVTTTSGSHINAAGGVINVTGKVEFGASAAQQIISASYGLVNISANYTISGGGTIHWYVESYGQIFAVVLTITLSGSPVFSTAFAHAATSPSLVDCRANTYSGSAGATTPRYTVGAGGVINTGTGSTTALPGTGAAGTPGTNFGTSPYGLYL